MSWIAMAQRQLGIMRANSPLPMPNFVNGFQIAGAAGMTRANLTEEVLKVYNLYGSDWLNGVASDPIPGPSGAATGLFNRGVVGTGVLGWDTFTANASIEQPLMATRFALPVEYVAGGDIRVVVTAKYTGAPETKQVDVLAYLVNTTAGTVGADICTTAIQTVTASFVQYSFTITPTGLVAGDSLQIIVLSNVIIAAATDASIQISNIALLCDIKG